MFDSCPSAIFMKSPFALPASVVRFVDGSDLIPDEIGESPCRVFHFQKQGERFYLKITPAIFTPTTYSVRREATLLDWLGERLKVPEVVLLDDDGNGEYMITRAVPGEPLGKRVINKTPMLALFCEAVRQLQSLPIDDCPYFAGAAFRLAELKYLLANGLYDQQADPGQWPGLAVPQDLLEHLHAHRFPEDPVFAHGDLGDSNILVGEKDELYFIDVGRAGVADRWMDIAFVHRNLREDVSAEAADDFLRTLDTQDAPEKRLFFEQLDELF